MIRRPGPLHRSHPTLIQTSSHCCCFERPLEARRSISQYLRAFWVGATFRKKDEKRWRLTAISSGNCSATSPLAPSVNGSRGNPVLFFPTPPVDCLSPSERIFKGAPFQETRKAGSNTLEVWEVAPRMSFAKLQWLPSPQPPLWPGSSAQKGNSSCRPPAQHLTRNDSHGNWKAKSQTKGD